MLRITGTCLSGHDFYWTSQPMCESTRRPAGNIAIAAATLHTGNTYTTMSEIFEEIKLATIHKSAFYKIQREFLLPNIEEMYESHIEDVRKRYDNLQGKLIVAGDCRHDSPGHNATFGTYSLMDTDTDLILASKTVSVNEEGIPNSHHLENVGLKRCLEELKEHKLNVDIISTDRHPMIGKTLRENYPEIKHEYDIWHLAKSVRKRVAAAGKKHKELQVWEKGIINHLWWSAETCQGSVTQLMERWTSIVRHIVDEHDWICGFEYMKCSHPPLEANMTKPWLTPESDAHKALQDIVTNNLLLRDLKKATEFCHTGNLEGFHNMMLKYMPKRSKFEHEGAIARTYLAVIDNNMTSNRSYATLADGESQYRLEWSKK
ncbi:uncharacterized protein [Antedon mediterranea]|uniref:uncharacterized protein isoform X1 n=1 Tax=Antedon mediterranea TaxID=105859 RepID=UPI003AF9E2F2